MPFWKAQMKFKATAELPAEFVHRTVVPGHGFLKLRQRRPHVRPHEVVRACRSVARRQLESRVERLIMALALLVSIITSLGDGDVATMVG